MVAVLARVKVPTISAFLHHDVVVLVLVDHWRRLQTSEIKQGES